MNYATRTLIPALVVCLAVAFALAGCGAGKYDSGYGRSGDKPYNGTEPTQRPYSIAGKHYYPMATAKGYVEKGRASWYGKKFHGRKTSNGETYNMYAMTAAHKTLPMNTWVSVENLENGRHVTLRINDRGPFVAGRIIDLTYTAARLIGMVGPGTARVKVTALGKATAYSKKDHSPVKFTPVDYWKGNFTVQVGAFTVRANADQYRIKLSMAYINAHIVPYEDDRGQFYRVRIGKFDNLNDAVAFSERLMARKGFRHAFAVAE
ncbi:MAG TPA: septal ring lytic transglycosylase RlpA family lipoprotein [Desulfobacter sp.]|jgi:rare lipoprotein A|uniref:septal ring lytic transglycosylase RlpA family protein n=1 Tax=Desulfobacter sp. TaxID=2294 RepID=UPI000E8055E1|nr:septal ring lytic transglycosylase RlpA family protein [Desulfobacter sp.]MDQ1269076.1 Endolytic peptidoglycan transglycosylase RlpA [Thermodesulfobacteriota bacterium]MBP8828751.1 septal ring lytic transglycosylase RlpA family protein [Desulfobacter sp.]MBP9597781.1 septal ring lytic transglycosylase RlpA family protein [Desulfobacter sp.]HAR33202.1 septal ring lytic transglycosylase RlpA family lipoprotein [Desulfobacter sp.]HBT89574.1 septal ring lytic transglycosylase RlpA family lipopr